MAGNYPDPIGPRIHYDRDGTQVYGISAANVVTQLTATQAAELNDEDSGAVAGSAIGTRIVFFFPELMDISGMYVQAYDGLSTTPSWSPDTTNGLDGTWTNLTAFTHPSGTAISPGYRTGVQARSATGAKAIRLTTNTGTQYYVFHLYGKPSSLAGNRLEFWHPTLDQSLSVTPAHLDWGNRPRGTSETRQVRVKNLSSTLTAQGVTVGMQALTDASPTYVSQHTFAYNGGAFGATATVGDLGPGAVSAVIDIKQDLLANAALSAWSQRIYADPTGWV